MVAPSVRGDSTVAPHVGARTGRKTRPAPDLRRPLAKLYPRQEKWIAAFNQRYLDARGPLPVRET
jgi:hypothetical protein